MPEQSFQTAAQPLPGVPDAATVLVRGRVTYREAPEFRTALLREIAGAAAARLVLELGQVDEMDTAGAAVLAEALKRGQQRGLRVLLCGASESVLRTFRLAGFEDVLGQCCSSVEETRRRLLE